MEAILRGSKVFLLRLARLPDPKDCFGCHVDVVMDGIKDKAFLRQIIIVQSYVNSDLSRCWRNRQG